MLSNLFPLLQLKREENQWPTGSVRTSFTRCIVSQLFCSAHCRGCDSDVTAGLAKYSQLPRSFALQLCTDPHRAQRSPPRAPSPSPALQRGQEPGRDVRSWRVVRLARFGWVRCGVSGRSGSQTGPRGRWSRQCRHAVRNWAARPPSRPAGRTGIAARPAAAITHAVQLAN